MPDAAMILLDLLSQVIGDFVEFAPLTHRQVPLMKR
jgi:hypothetical protein